MEAATIEDIKNRVDLSDVARWLGLHGQGGRFECPVCKPNQTPNLSIKDGRFMCFNCPDVSGDAIDLVMLETGMLFQSAVKWLADMVDVELEFTQITDKRVRSRGVRSARALFLSGQLNIADRAQIFEYFLNACRPVKEEPLAMSYLTGRGLRPSTIEQMNIRFCGRAYQEIMVDVESQFGGQRLFDVGLLKEKQSGNGLYPTFWPYHANKAGFILFPYYQEGRPVYMKARVPTNRRTIKALNVPRMMTTGGTVPCPYNVDALPGYKGGRVFICEGEIDTLSVLSNGENAVGISGASHFPPSWVSLFDGVNIVMAFDNDEAGREVNAKVSAIFRANGRKETKKVDIPDGYDINRWYLEKIREREKKNE